MSSILQNIKRNIKGKKSPTSQPPSRGQLGLFSNEASKKDYLSHKELQNGVNAESENIYVHSKNNSQMPVKEQTGRLAETGERESRSRKVRTPTDDGKENKQLRRPPRSRSAFASLTNGMLEDSGVDLDSSQGGTSYCSDMKLSPNHSRDSSHVSQTAGQTANNVPVVPVVQRQVASMHMAENSNRDYIKMDEGRRRSSNGVISHIRDISQSSSHSGASSSSSSKSHHSDPQHNRPSNMRSGIKTPQDEIYMKMTDFENSNQKSKSLEDIYGVRFSAPKESVSKRSVSSVPSKPIDHEYVNLTQLAMQLKLDSGNRNTDLNHKNKQYLSKTKTTSGNSQVGTVKESVVHLIQAQVHQTQATVPKQIPKDSRTTELKNSLRFSRNDNRPFPYRKPVSEESDLESNSESVTSQEVAVLTAVSRRRRLHHKHVSFPTAQTKGNDVNRSLVSFAEQSILSFLSNMDANTDSESELGSLRFEHATREFIKASPTPTNLNSDTGGSPVRLEAATPTNESHSHTSPTLHQIVSCFDLTALTLCKTGYRYPHYGIHVALRHFKEYTSPVSDISSRNSSKLSVSKSAFTPPGGLANDNVMLPVVMSIDQDGVAGHDSRIKEGDFIIEVNGISVFSKSADETEAIINSEEMVHLVITKGRQGSSFRSLRTS